MILTMAGVIVLIIAIGEGEVPKIIVGAVMIGLGITLMYAMYTNYLMDHNRRMYWAYGKRPDNGGNVNVVIANYREPVVTRRCAYCGHAVSANDRFCGQCGIRIYRP